MEAVQPVLSERTNPLLNRSASPSGVTQLQLQSHADNDAGFYNGTYSFLDTRPCTTRFSSGSVTSEDSPALTPRLLSFKSSSSPDNCAEWPERAVASQSNRYLFDANAHTRCAEYLDLMRVKVDAQLCKLKGGVTGLESYALPENGHVIGGAHLGMSLDVMLIEIDERFNALKLLIGSVFRQAREMLGSVNSSVSNLQWEHELQLEVFGAVIGECIGGLQEELERKLYEQIKITNTMSRNWKEAITQFAAMHEDFGALCKLLLPSVPEAHISNSKHENSGNRSNRWKYNFFGKKTREDRSPRAEESKSFRKQKSFGAKDVISEKSDFRHLDGRTRDEVISYFKSEISKLKRMHESALQEKTEELFRFKREKGSHALKNDVEFEPLRKKIPEIMLRMDQIISKNIQIPAVCMTHNELDERCRLTSRINALYYENQHLRGLLADKMKDAKDLSSQLSESNRKLSLQLSSEEELLRQIDKIREEYEDLRIEGDVRGGLYQTVTRGLLDDSMNNMNGVALNFNEKVSSLESVISEKDKALCSSNEEYRKLKEKLVQLKKGCFIQDHQEDPEVIKQESTEIVLRDIEVEPHPSPLRSQVQDLQCDELIKLNSSLEIASGTLKEIDRKNMDHCSSVTKNEQEEQLECILVSIMNLSKEFVDIEQKLSMERTENRSKDLSDHCNYMVRQAVVLTKIGLWYKQMLETRRSELQKAEAKVVILGDKMNAHLSLLQKIYVTLDRYSPTLQHHPVLLDAFFKTCKLVADLRSKQNEGLRFG
ncbi:WPP domain-associated protein-like [Phragmites australis]|uniref:WPP domain-associated protein-like n=1 Tax=Phragmites australis TaxID=29695 RepID=UPI002D79FBBC|nr:WPP domain-associated protein-like [Phragmites australis]XP_062214400.1 WPP domain-associated protein-like [Phragmites australis]XP_062214401.1 WPP domain-associated protein-like [Phragmites australis]